MRYILFSFTILLALCCSLAYAHKGASGVVLERMEQMKSIASAMKAIGKTLKTDTPDVTVIKNSANSIASDAEHVPHMFPADSFKAPSEASLKILEDRTGFEKLNLAMKTDAAALAALASESAELTALKAGFDKLGGSCKSCHQEFREKR